MSHRSGREFSELTKDASMRLFDHKCAECREPVENPQFHHEVELWFASRYFPELSREILKSVLNCRPVHTECHKKINRQDRTEELVELARILLLYQGEKLI